MIFNLKLHSIKTLSNSQRYDIGFKTNANSTSHVSKMSNLIEVEEASHIRHLSKLDNFAVSSRNEAFENRSLQGVNEDSKKVNDDEIKQKNQIRKMSIEIRFPQD